MLIEQSSPSTKSYASGIHYTKISNDKQKATDKYENMYEDVAIIETNVITLEPKMNTKLS
jgi:hypothetical protein